MSVELPSTTTAITEAPKKRRLPWLTRPVVAKPPMPASLASPNGQPGPATPPILNVRPTPPTSLPAAPVAKRRALPWARKPATPIVSGPAAAAPVATGLVVEETSAEPSAAVLGTQEAAQPFSPASYSEPQRFVLDVAMRSSGIDASERDAANLRAAFARAQTRKVGLGPAAYANNIIRQVESARAQSIDGVTLLDATPYIDPSGAFATSFLNGMIECAPESLAAETPPTTELRAASEAVTYDYLTSFMASARPSDFACANGRACFGMRLFDEHGRPLPPTVWKVFFKPSELPDVLDNPQRFEHDAKTRYCIGCKLELAVNRVYTISAHNARMRPNLLACNIHVFVDLPGEFPVAATVGLGSTGYHGLVQNIPRISRVGWRTAPDSQCTGCFVYTWNVPRFPVPLAYYTRDNAGGTAPSF